MELLDIYNDFGKTTGRVIKRGDKSVKLNRDEHIAVAVIFIDAFPWCCDSRQSRKRSGCCQN